LQSLHLFGSYGEPSTVANLPQFTKTISTTWEAKSKQPRLWHIQGTGRSRQRRDAAVQLTPLTRLQVQEDEGSFCDRPMAKLSVKLGGQYSRRPLLIDGDSSLTVYASSVSVSALVPPAVESVDEPTGPLLAPLRTIVVDDILGCEILAVPTSDGGASTVFSQYVVAGDAVRASFAVPHGATELLIEPETVAASTWTWLIGDRNSGALGGSSFTLGSFSPDNNPIRVPGASHIEVAAAAGPRGFLLTWKVR